MLVLTSLGMVIVNPGWLTDVGFQLSVAAMVGMIFFARKSVWSQVLACQLTTLPLVLHYFGNLSVMAPAANLLLLWPAGIAMPVLAVAAALGMLNSAWGSYVAVTSWPLLKFMTEGVNILSSINWASLTVDKMGWGWVAGYYLALLLFKWKLVGRSEKES